MACPSQLRLEITQIEHTNGITIRNGRKKPDLAIVSRSNEKGAKLELISAGSVL